MIPSYVKDQILEHDIVSILRDEGLDLKKKGRDYECCCPFHGEKTPSFKVSPTRNIYHCFGCGESGDAISYVQHKHGFTFVEALEYLAKKLDIEYTKEELTPQQREEEFHRESMRAANKAALQYFRECYKQSKPAQTYAIGRWAKETIEIFSIGYAPHHGGLMEHLTESGFKREILLDAGLIKQNEENLTYYDTFRDRLIFPIYNRTGNVIGFSGRYIGQKDAPKYLNTAQTALFSKGKELFGLFFAQRQIATTSTVVLVEGNPDVIRLHEIGVQNAVAPLGTALTTDQINLLAKKAKSAILIGDTDPAGIDAVISHGEDLLKAGFSVRVMILPNDERKKKVDPDDYFRVHPRDYEDCLTRHTFDFIPWLCNRKMDGLQSQTERAATISEIAQLLALCPDQTSVEMYLDQFQKQWKNSKVWVKEYFDAKNAHSRKVAREEDADSMEMAREYGFYIKNNCYFGVGQRSEDRRWTNYTLKPIIHIRDERNARRVFLMKNTRGQEAVIKFAQSELVSFADFKTRTETKGNFVWEAGPNELTMLKKYLYNDTPSADEIKQLGWQRKHQFYAWGNGGLDNGTFVPANKYGIIEIMSKNFYLPGCALDTSDDTQGYQHQRKFVFVRANSITLQEYASKLIAVFGENAKIALCFLIATLFKDIVTSVTTSFPILNLFGPKGTGKSELGHSLTSFFIPNNIAPNINNTTKAALAEAVAEVSNAVVHLDEYKNSLDIEKREFLKGLWDGAGRSRMNMDNDKKREITAVDCGVVMSGQEMPTADIALFNRLVFLTFSKSEFSDEEKQRYEELKRIEKRGLTHLTAEILMLRHQFQGNFRSAWDTAVYDLSQKVKRMGVEDRTLKNWATILAAFKSVESSINLPFNYNGLLDLSSRLCAEQNDKTKQNNELSGFWEIVDILVSSGKIWEKVDYHIKQGGGSARPVSIRESRNGLELKADNQYLYINFKRISQLYAKEGKDGSNKIIPRETLKYYLEHSPEFMGTARSCRFKMVDSPTFVPEDGANAKSKVTTAMIFDYSMIKNNYSIYLDVERGYDEKDIADDGETF